ncbi:MAG: Fic family protein [Patescibacteria group bacterium]
MYKPNFEITPKILDLISKISSARETIFSAQLIPQWEVSLRRDAILNNAHASTNIEGNTLSKNEVTELSLGRDVLKTKKEKQEVLNYLSALSNLEKLTKNKNITKKNILKAHKWIVKETLENKEWEGACRNIQVYIGNTKTGIISFVPPKPEEIEEQLDSFLSWLNSDHKIHPILEAGITHYEIARIHPFADGNGRLARFIATWILVNRGFDIKRFFALDDYYNSDRRNYYEALKTVDRETINITKWLEYFIDGVAVSSEATKKKVLMLSGGKKKSGTKQITLAEREIKIIEYINRHSQITNSETQRILNVKRQVATKELAKLVKKNVIRKIGTYKDAKYILKD